LFRAPPPPHRDHPTAHRPHATLPFLGYFPLPSTKASVSPSGRRVAYRLRRVGKRVDWHQRSLLQTSRHVVGFTRKLIATCSLYFPLRIGRWKEAWKNSAGMTVNRDWRFKESAPRLLLNCHRFLKRRSVSALSSVSTPNSRTSKEGIS